MSAELWTLKIVMWTPPTGVIHHPCSNLHDSGETDVGARMDIEVDVLDATMDSHNSHGSDANILICSHGIGNMYYKKNIIP